MPEIQPFAGLRYNLAKVGSLSDVVAPPYDVIDDALDEQLLQKSPYNVVRLILDKMNPEDDAENNRYTRTAKRLKNWKDEAVLVREKNAAIYVYHQVYTVNGREYVRKGFMCGCKAIPFGEGMVFPHEITMSGPKLDRYMLTVACKTNFSQIFGLYPDPESKVQAILEEKVTQSGEPPIEATDHLGVVSRMWVVTDPTVIGEVVKMMGDKPIFVADGHHRYETACNYRQYIADQGLLTPDHPANYVLMVCVAMEDPGLIVLPTHRLFSGLPEMTKDELAEKLGNCFEIEEIPSSQTGPDAAFDVWERIELENDQNRIGLFTTKDQKWVIAKLTEAGHEKMLEAACDHHPEWGELGVSLLHKLIIETLLGQKEVPKPNYVHLVDEVVTELKTNPQKYPLAALVMPATVDQIRNLSMLRERMPAKSTYFYPKLLTGLVFNPLE